MEDTHELGRFRSYRGLEYRIRRDSTSSFYYIKPGKGPVPEKLKGRFKAFKDAERLLVKFLKSKERVLFPATYPKG